MYEAARVDDQLAHSKWGQALLAGALVGAAVLLTGGLAIGAIALAGLAGGAVAGAVGSRHSFDGPIKTGASRVFIGGHGFAAARAIVDKVGCHDPQVIAQGSRTVAIEDNPAARISDATECGGKIGEGCSTVLIGAEPETYVRVRNEVPWGLRLFLGLTLVVTSGFALKSQISNPKAYFKGLFSKQPGLFSKLDSLKQWLKGHPVDVATGNVVDTVEDFSLPGPIPVVWKRTYGSSQAEEETSLGVGGWALDWEQWITEEPDLWVLRAEEGRDIYFEKVGPGASTYHARERLTLTCGEDGELAVYSHGLQRTRRFEATAKGERSLLRRVEDKHGNTVTLYYEDNKLAQVHDAAGRTVALTRDYGDRITRVEIQIAGSVVQWVDYEYHPGGELAAVTDAEGGRDTFTYDARHRMGSTTLKNGVSFYYAYDDETGRCIKTWGDGGLHTVELTYDLAEGRTEIGGGSIAPRVCYWDDLGLVRREELLDGRSTRICDVDENGFVIAEGITEDACTRHAYDAFGNRTETIDPAGNVTRWTYLDDLPTTRVDPDGHTTHFEHDDRGSLSAVTYPTGFRYELRRDLHGRLVSVHDGDRVIARFSYSTSHDLVSETDARGATTTYAYDRLGRPVERRDALGQVSRIARDTMGRPTSLHSPDGAVSQTTYDALGNPRRIVDPLGQITEMEYAGTGVLTRLHQSDGQDWELGYDSDERLSEVRNPARERYRFSYNDAGQVASEQAFDGRTLKYKYSAAGHLASILYPDQRSRTFQRDPLGNVVVDRALDSEVAIERDKLGRVTKATLKESSGKVVTELIRDTFGRVVEERQNEHTINHAYDDRGRRVERVLPNGSTTRYGYDESHALAFVEHDGKRFAVQRDALGRETSRSAADGNVEIRSGYDAMSRLVERTSLGGSTTLSQRTWGYDALGRVKEIGDDRWGTTWYQYDSIGQLLEAKRGKRSELFHYDITGSLRNILGGLGQASEGRVWDTDAGNLLTRTDKARYAYDARGRRSQKVALVDPDQGGERASSVTSYVWDERDRLREVRKPTGERILFTYDAFGRRVRKEVMSTDGATAPRVVEFLWDGNELAADIESKRGARVFVHEPGTFIPMLQAEQGEVFAVVNDHLGMPKELVDQDGRVAWSAAHSAWGKVVEEYRDPSGRRKIPVESPFRLLGQYADEETGLCYTRFRYFDAETGRWCSPDPLGIGGGLNLSGFDGSPTVVVDPFGLCKSPGASEATEGIYEFTGQSGEKYVGQSENIPRRLQEHFKSGKLPEGAEATTKEVLGGKLAREIAEQRRIDELGGIGKLENKVNPIGPKRQNLMDQFLEKLR